MQRSELPSSWQDALAMMECSPDIRPRQWWVILDSVSNSHYHKSLPKRLSKLFLQHSEGCWLKLVGGVYRIRPMSHLLEALV